MRQDGNCLREVHGNSLHYFIPVKLSIFHKKKGKKIKKLQEALKIKPTISSQNRESDKIKAVILKTESTNP